MIESEIFNRNLEAISGGRDLTNTQRSFYEFARNTINNDKDTTKVTVFSARCGLGKSTFLATLIASWLESNKDDGLMIVTDNIERLKSLNATNSDKVACITADNKQTELARSYRCPVLLISTQRYFLTDDLSVFGSYYVNGALHKRNTVIFDESPYFFSNGEIRIDEINYLHTALNEGITDAYNADDKAWIISEYDRFREKMIAEINALEVKRAKTTYLFYQPKQDCITSDDNRFTRILDENMSYLMSKYPDTKRIVRMLFEFVQNGAIYKCLKVRSGANAYTKGFIISKSLKDKFNLGGNVKTFVFDATAKISEMYPYDADWITMHECDEYEVDMSYMTIHLYDINTSRNALLNKPDKEAKVQTIKDYISDLALDVSDTLLVSYKPMIEDGMFEDIGFTDDNTLYFGNVRGKNEHRDKHNYIQIGLNRQTDINYVLTLLANNEDYNLATKNDILNADESMEAFDRLMRSDLCEGYMDAELMADLVQNVYRIKARDIANTDEVHVYLFCQKSELFMQELYYAFLRHGAKFVDGNLFEAAKNKAMARNCGRKTNTQKIFDWIESKPTGTIFKVTELLSETGISNNQLKSNKKNNPKIKELFQSMETDKKGYYRIQ